MSAFFEWDDEGYRGCGENCFQSLSISLVSSEMWRERKFERRTSYSCQAASVQHHFIIILRSFQTEGLGVRSSHLYCNLYIYIYVIIYACAWVLEGTKVQMTHLLWYPDSLKFGGLQSRNRCFACRWCHVIRTWAFRDIWVYILRMFCIICVYNKYNMYIYIYINIYM